MVDVKEIIVRARNPKVRALIQTLFENGYIIRLHPSDDNKLNIYSTKKQKNVVGDISLSSLNGSFRLESKEDGKWRTFRDFDIDINDIDFVESVIVQINK
jgi:hypothetical protein